MDANTSEAKPVVVSTSKPNNQRLSCIICSTYIDPEDTSHLKLFPCNVRAFKGELFEVWRCPNCHSIHCLDIVDLDHYYAKYHIASAQLSYPLQLAYYNLSRQFTKHGFSKKHSFLDYGCGTNKLFVQYLKQWGFTQVYAYDPYGASNNINDRSILQQETFNYILLQDVIEHVENPNDLLDQLNTLLAPGGYILIGTPNAAKINLTRPDLSDYYNAVHVPYHLHLYTPETLKLLGHHQGWQVVDFFDRGYADLPFILNDRAWNEYLRLCDGTADALYEPVKYGKLLFSYKYLFYSMFGYWLSFKTEMSLMFRKTGV